MISQKIITETIQRLTEGETLRDIARSKQLPISSLYSVLRTATGKTVKDIAPRQVRVTRRHAAPIRMIQEGLSVSEVASVMGVSRQVVSIWIKDANITPPKKKAIENARELVRSAMISYTEIVEQTGLSTTTIQKLIREEQVKLPLCSRPLHQEYSSVIQDLQSGMKMARVGQKYGIPFTTVRRWAVKEGINPQKNS